jgi:hypothetical protein
MALPSQPAPAGTSNRGTKNGVCKPTEQADGKMLRKPLSLKYPVFEAGLALAKAAGPPSTTTYRSRARNRHQ